MGSVSMPIAESLKLSDFIMNTVTADLDDTVARRRARGTEGASIAWVIGHLIHYRHEILGLLGQSTSNPFQAKFGAAGATDGADYPAMAELLDAWNSMSEKVVSAVAAADDAALTKPMPQQGAPHGEKRVLDMIVFLMWHESYHLGQVGTLRAQFGLTPTATLATAAN